MVEQVWSNPAVHCIKVGLPQNPLRNLNVYVIRTPERSLIIDTGFRRPECREALWEGIRELELDLSKTALFLTHLHSDHTGLVWDFVDRGVPVYMGGIDWDYLSISNRRVRWTGLEEIFEREGFPPECLAQQEGGNQARLYAPEPGFPAVALEHGDRIPMGGLEATVLHTPGHTPGHMVLYLPKEQLLFCGDHILFDITPNISVWNQVPHSLRDYLNSLSAIDALPIRAAFPAHRAGGGEADAAHRRIKELKAHHAQRLEEIYQAVAAAPDSTAYQVAGKITWSVRGLPWEEFPPHQRWFAMGETLSHLYYLAEEKRVSRLQKDGHAVYRAVVG